MFNSYDVMPASVLRMHSESSPAIDMQSNAFVTPKFHRGDVFLGFQTAGYR